MLNNFKKYRYLGQVVPEVPKSWEPHIMEMFIKLDKIARHKFIPLFLLNFINTVFPLLLEKLMPSIFITQIKQKFGVLRVYGTFSSRAQKIVSQTESLCNNTCEFCGNPNTTRVMVKSWIRNLCATCKEVKKYGTNN
jgi:ribosomal protein L37AE/L43A